MNHSSFVEAVAEDSGLTRKDAAAVLSSVAKVIGHTLSARNEVKWTGLGTFRTRRRDARKGRNPATGAAIEIASSVKAVFAPSAVLRDVVSTEAAQG